MTLKSRIEAERQSGPPEKRILAIHEFMALSYGFDFPTFMVEAELERVKEKASKIDVALVRHVGDDESAGPWFPNHDKARHYFHNIVLEQLRLFTNVGSIFAFDNRCQFESFLESNQTDYILYPHNYSTLIQSDAFYNWVNIISEPITAERPLELTTAPELQTVLAPQQQINIVRKWVRRHVYPKIPITITLRECDDSIVLNSNPEAWQKLVDSYIEQEIVFVICPDYARLYEEPALVGPNVIYYNEPVLVMSLRAALYQECPLNLFVANGCASLSWFNPQINFLQFSPMCLDIPVDFLNGRGDHNPQFRKIIEAGDSFEVIKNQLDSTIAQMKKEGIFTPNYFETFATQKEPKIPSKVPMQPYEKYRHLFNGPYIKRAMEKLFIEKDLRNQRIIIYGAGRHTHYLVKHTQITQANIVALVDKDPTKSHSSAFDKPIVRPNELMNFKPDHILISSNGFEDEIYKSLQPLKEQGIGIIRLYGSN